MIRIPDRKMMALISFRVASLLLPVSIWLGNNNTNDSDANNNADDNDNHDKDHLVQMLLA